MLDKLTHAFGWVRLIWVDGGYVGSALAQWLKALLPRRGLRLEVVKRTELHAIHYALEAMGLTYKKRHCEPASRTGRTSRRPAGRGVGGNRASIPPGSSSSTSRGRRPT